MGFGSELARIARLVPAALVSGLVGGAVTGLGARLVMFGIRLSNSAYNGATTHKGFVNGRWTMEGTMAIVVEGMFFGIVGGPLYLLVRRFLGPTRLRRGVFAGLLLLLAFGSDILDGSYEFSRFVSPRISVPAFAALFLLYGVVVAFVADVIAPPAAMRHPRLRPIGVAVLVIGAVALTWQLATVLRFRYTF